MCQAEPERPRGKPVGGALGPFDEGDGGAIEQLAESESAGVFVGLQPVEVEVEQLAFDVLLAEIPETIPP